MDPYKNTATDISQNPVQDEGDGIDWYKAAEERNIRESLNLSYTGRFKIMMRLMRIDNMLSRAKIIHKKSST